MQADRVLYRQAIRSTLEQTDGVDLFQDAVEDIELTAGAVSGVVTRTGIVFALSGSADSGHIPSREDARRRGKSLRWAHG